MEGILLRNRIISIRDQRVILDIYLAEIFGISLERFSKKIWLYKNRFSEGSFFKLSYGEWTGVKRRNDISGNIYRGYFPTGFTESGVVKLFQIFEEENILQSNLKILETFVEMRNNELQYEL